MKKIYFFIGILLCSTGVWGQTNLYIQGANTWNTVLTNWGTVPAGSGNLWSNTSVANLESTPAIVLTGFNPFAYGVNCTSTGTLTNTVLNERLYLAGNVNPAIDVSASQNFLLNNILAGGMGLSKTGAGTLTFGNNNNKFLNFSNGININGGVIDFFSATSMASAALRSMPVNITASNTLQYSGGIASDMRFGGLSGAGILSLGVANNGFEYITANASSSATISGAGFSLRGTGGAVQTLTGNTSGLTATVAVHAVPALDGAGGTTSGLALTGAGSNTFNNATNIFGIRGGRFTIDNTTNNLITRFPTVATNNMISFLGGTFELLGNSAGTGFTIGTGYATTAKATAFNAGQNNIIVNQPVGAAGPTVLTFGAGPTATGLRDQTRMTINFSSTGSGTLGASATSPQIKYATAPITTATSITAPNNMLANSAGGALVGWATVNNIDWATYGANGVVARATDLTTTSTAGLQGGLVTETVLFNPGGAPAAATGFVAASVIIFDPTVAGLTLPMGAFNLNGIALMHRGINNFTITGTGNILAGSPTTRYIYVMNPAGVLSTDALINSSSPITKSGDGTFALTNTSVNQVSFGSNQNINLCGGVFRATAVGLGGATSAGGILSTFNFYGGILELDGGMVFSRAINLPGTVSGGGINFDGGAIQRGSGGFSAINGASSVTLVTTVGGTTAATLLWNNGAWLSDGYSLLMGSKLSDNRITLTNNIGLDDGVFTNSYVAREVYVYDNSGSTNDEGELSGVISGGLNADLVKSGPGKLRLSNVANTYSGNTIVAQGTLAAVATGSLPAATSLLVKNGATLQLLANNTITDLVLEAGSTLALGSATLTLTGNFTNNGGSITGGTVVFNGTSQQYIDGVAATTFYNLTLNNGTGMIMLADVTVNNILALTQGTLNTSINNLTIAGTVTRSTGNIDASRGTVIFTNTISINLPVASFTGNIKNLTMNGFGGVILNDNNTITNILALFFGIIRIPAAANILTMAAGSSAGGSIGISYVDGKVKKIGNTIFIFPVGKTGFGGVPIALSFIAGGTVTDEFTAEYKRGNARLLGPVTAIGLNHVSGCDYWTLDKGTATPISVDITCYWSSNNVCNGTYVDNLPQLVIAHFNGTSWDAFGTIGTATGTPASGNVTWSGVTTFSPFSLASTSLNNPLPITINYFTGTRQNGNHLLNWKVTCNSTPRVTMVLERSADSRNFSAINTVTADAVRCRQPFDYTDNQPAPGINYYRLKMVDADGKISYSSMVSLINAVKGIDILNIAPNPIVNSRFNLNVSAAQKTQMEIVITDMQGRVMQKQTVNLIAGFNTIPMNVLNFSAGTYQVYGITADGRSKVMRFVVQ